MASSLHSVRSPVFSVTDMKQNDKYYRLKSRLEARYNWHERTLLNHKLCQNNKICLQKLSAYKERTRVRVNLLVKLINTPTTLVTSKQRRTYLRILHSCEGWSERTLQFEELFGIPLGTADRPDSETHIKAYLEKLEQGSKEACKMSTEARIRLALHEAKRNGWFPIFGTLTVSPEHYETVFKNGSKAWTRFIDNLTNYVKSKTYGSKRAGKGKHCFDYLAIVEQGGEGSRLHIHIVFMIKSICGLKDPNLGLKDAYKTELTQLRHLWKYGYSQFVPMRYGNNDTYGQLGWRWPKLGPNQPLEAGSVEKVAGYMAKYLVKSEKVKINAEIITWRTRKSRNLGVRRLINSLSQMNRWQLLSLVVYRKYPMAVSLYGFQIPSKLIRYQAVKIMCSRLRKENLNPCDLVMKKTSALDMLLSNMIPLNPTHNCVNIGDIMIQIVENPPISNGYQEHFNDARQVLHSEFPASGVATPVSCGF